MADSATETGLSNPASGSQDAGATECLGVAETVVGMEANENRPERNDAGTLPNLSEPEDLTDADAAGLNESTSSVRDGSTTVDTPTERKKKASRGVAVPELLEA